MFSVTFQIQKAQSLFMRKERELMMMRLVSGMTPGNGDGRGEKELWAFFLCCCD